MKDPVIIRIFKNEQLIAVQQFTGDQLIVGRNADIGITLEDDHVAPIHAMFEKRQDEFFISDLGSQSGTFKNAEQVLESSLSSGDEIQIGPFRLVFYVGIPKPIAKAPASTSATAAPVEKPPAKEEVKVQAVVESAPQQKVSEPPQPVAKATEPEKTLTKDINVESVFEGISLQEDETPEEVVEESSLGELDLKVDAPIDPERTQSILVPTEPGAEEVKTTSSVEAKTPILQKIPEPPVDEPSPPVEAKAAEPPVVEKTPEPPVVEKTPEPKAPAKPVEPVSAAPSEAPKAATPSTESAPVTNVATAASGFVKPNLDGKKKGGTYAPRSHFKELNEVISPSKGDVVEVIVAWQERALETYHFKAQGKVYAGSHPSAAVHLPLTVANQKKFLLLNLSGGVEVSVPNPYHGEIITAERSLDFEELTRQQRVMVDASARKVRLEQNEMVKMELGEGIRIYVRYVPQTALAPLAPVLPFTSSELTAMVVSVMLVSLLAIFVAIYSPPKGIGLEDDESVMRIATFVYEKPPTPPPPRPEPTPPPPPPEKPKEPPKPPKIEPQKVKVDLTKKPPSKAQKKQASPNPTANAAAQQQRAAKANEMRPKDGKDKSFTSVRQGGAKKLGETDSANAQSEKKDVSKIGLFGAFGGKGTREKLDQAYSGAGEILGAADRATGTSGQNSDRAGNDLGSRFKDTGMGGKGTATEGIAGVKTTGRSSGQAAYGQTGFGGRENVSIDIGGTEEEFDGRLDRDAILRVIRSNLHHVRACYEMELNRSSQAFEGRVVLSWEIGGGGRVVGQPKVVSNTLGNNRVPDCVINRLRVWRFPDPPPGLIGEISFPFAFRRTL